MPEIVKGEKSLIYMGDEFSHAVIKIPQKGNFLTNLHQKGKVMIYNPTKEEINLGFEIKKNWNSDLNIFRLDLAEYNNAPAIIEVETVNPSFYSQYFDKLSNIGIWEM